MTRVTVAVILVSISFGAYADEKFAEWRLGGSLVYSDYQRDDGVIEDAGTGFKIFAEYRFNRWFAVEGNFFSSPDFEGDADPVAAGGEAETSMQGAILSGIAFLPSPVERIDFFAKAGYFNFFDLNLKVDGNATDTGSADGLTLGAGLAVRATESIGIRLEFDWYDLPGAELWTVGLGAEYRF